MNYNFTGSVTQRRINLGSAREITSSQLTQQAREERALRLEIRQKNIAATRIQSTYRGSRVIQEERQRLKDRFEHAVAGGNFIQATSIIALATRRQSTFDRLRRAGRSAVLTQSEAASLQSDDASLKSWAALALQQDDEHNGEQQVPALLHWYTNSMCWSLSASNTVIPHRRRSIFQELSAKCAEYYTVPSAIPTCFNTEGLSDIH